jgi:hypothetical protein
MTWIGALPIMVLCGVLLVAPGVLITYLLGLRRVAAVAMAPMVVVGVVALTAMAAAGLGFAWSPMLLLIVFASLTVLLAAVVLPLRRRLPQPAAGDSWPAVLASVAGVAAAIVLGTLTIIRAIGTPEELVQTEDAPFHYNTIVTILNSGNASSFAMDTLGVPDRVAKFYPAAWHGLGSLLVMITGISVNAAANILSVTIALVVWPLGCVLLMRQLAGRSALAMGLAGLLSVGFGAFPWELLGWGILWPNLLGLSLVPAAMAVLLSITNLAQDDVIGRGRAWLLAPFVFLTLAFSHPNAVTSLAVIAIPPVALSLILVARNQYRAGRKARAALVLSPIVLGPLLYVLAAELGLLERVMLSNPPALTTPAAAIGEVLTGATNQRSVHWVLSALVIIGMIACFRQRRRRWLVVSHLFACALYVVGIGMSNVGRTAVTGFWYTDTHRLAAIVPFTGVPLVVIGLIAVISAVRRLVTWRNEDRAGLARAMAVLVPVVAIVALLWSTWGLNFRDHRDRVLAAYPKANPLVRPDEYALYARIGQLTEPGTIIAHLPVNGSPAAMTLSRRQLLYPQFGTAVLTPDQAYLKDHLNKAAHDPKVCEVADRLNVRYLLASNFIMDPRFPGVTSPEPNDGFELVDQGGRFALWRITACAGKSD